MAELGRVKARRSASALTATPCDLAAGSIDPRGDVAGDHRRPAAIDRLDRRARRLARAHRRSRCRRSRRRPRPSPPGAHPGCPRGARSLRRIGAGSPRRRRSSPLSARAAAPRPEAGPGQMPSRDQAVAAVVALAADDPHRPLAAQLDHRLGQRRCRPPPSAASEATPCSSIAQRSTARIPSASNSGCSHGSMRSLTARAGLGDRATAAANSREWVSEISIRRSPAPAASPAGREPHPRRLAGEDLDLAQARSRAQSQRLDHRLLGREARRQVSAGPGARGARSRARPAVKIARRRAAGGAPGPAPGGRSPAGRCRCRAGKRPPLLLEADDQLRRVRPSADARRRSAT